MKRQRMLTILSPIHWKQVRPTVEDGRIIAVCDLLNLTIEADKPEDLQSTMQSAFTLFFQDLAREGELETFCKENGIQYSIDDVIIQEPTPLALGEPENALSV
jgi:hypothetical protein